MYLLVWNESQKQIDYFPNDINPMLSVMEANVIPVKYELNL
jgi:hypothetical protein